MLNTSQVLPRSARGSAALFAACLLGLSSASAQGVERGDVPNPLDADSFARAAALSLGAPRAEITVERVEGPIVLPETGLTLWVASALRGDEKAVIALDANGIQHDLAQAKLNEGLAAIGRRGKLSPALYERLSEAPTQPVLVAAWLDVEGVEDARLVEAAAIEALDEAGQATEEAVDERLAAMSAGVRSIVEPATRAFGDDLTARGFQVLQTDAYAPLVFLRLNPQRLAELTSDPRVLELDSAEGEYGPRLSNAYKEVRADKLYSTYPSADASYTRVGVVEGGRPCEGPWLDIVEFRQSGSNSSHTTGVAGCVASSHGTHKGVAKNAKLYAANNANFTSGSFFTSGFAGSVDAISWAISKGCHVMNLSYGAGAPTSSVTGFDRYLDYVGRVNAKTLAIACGNSGAHAGDPGAGYNQVAVGNFYDQNDYNWTGETMASSSSWQNPSTGVETPQIAAPGTNLFMPDCSSGTSYFASGTSFSAPIVAGAAAVVIDRQPSLGGWPEPVRAILMASAWHNIEGSSRLSSKDGAGGLDAYAAYRVANRGKGWGYQYGSLTESSFDSSDLYTAQTVYISAGTKVRACLSFDSQVAKQSILGIFTYYTSSLESDLDFRAYSPTGSLIASSSSSVNPFEMLEFTAPSSGYYSFKIRNWSFGSGSEYFGTAVSLSSDKGE
ncbi:MAG: S8 family serine peptidase [Planctomycetota bacterium]